MGLLKITYRTLSDEDEKGKWSVASVSKTDFNKFNPAVLGLGDISKDGETTEALAAIFDLEGFTGFCSQIDHHLVVPEFLSEFLKWLFDEISHYFKKGEIKDRVKVWGSLPFFSKFSGDGVMFLWDTGHNVETYSSIGNIVALLKTICEDYINNFLPKIKNRVARPPLRLRCGIARGQIISIGNGKDFVGACINTASRLQKVSQLSFACSRRGFDPDKCFDESIKTWFIVKRVSIRGVGEDELILVLKEEFESLSSDEKKYFKAP
jgi:hypothetical protein